MKQMSSQFVMMKKPSLFILKREQTIVDKRYVMFQQSVIW